MNIDKKIITKFDEFRNNKVKKQQKSGNFEPLADDIIFLKNSIGEYEKTKEKVEIVQITGVITDENEIKKIEEMLVQNTPMAIGEVKIGDTVWISAIIKQPQTSYNPQTLGVLQCRIVNIYKGLTKLNTLPK